MAPTNTTLLSASLSATTAVVNPTRSHIVLAAQTALQAPTLTPSPSPSSAHKHLSSAAIAGLATVSVVLFISLCALTVGLCVLFTNRRRARRAQSKTFLREQGKPAPQMQRTTYDSPVSRPGMLGTGGWQRMQDDQSSSTSSRTHVDSAPSTGKSAPGEHHVPMQSSNGSTLFRFEQVHTGKTPSHKKRWSQKGHGDLPLSPLDDEFNLSRLSEIKL